MANELMEMQRYERRPLPTARDLVAVLFRQRWVILGAFLGVVLLVLLSGLWTTKYQAQMKILVLRQRMDAVVTAQPNPPAEVTPEITEADLNSEVELLLSDDLLRSVVLETGLEKQSRSIFGHENENVAVASALRTLSQNLNVEPVTKTNVIAVTFKSRNPELAARVLKAVEAAYIRKHSEVHRPSGEFTFFEQQTDQYHRGLELAQEQLAEFTQKRGVVSAQTEGNLALQRLSDFDAGAHQAQASAVETEQRIRALEAELRDMQPRLTTQIMTGQNPMLMQQLKSTLLNLELKRTELLTKFDPTYRLVQEVNEQIAETRGAIASAEDKPPQETTTDQDPTYQMLRSELAKAQENLAAFNALAAADRTTAARYREAARSLEQARLEQADLDRNVTTQENNYLLYLKKREEARISNALDQRGILNVAVVEQPVVPALPVRSRAKTAGLTLLLGLFVSLGAGFFADYASPSFRTPDEVAGYLDLPVLGYLPKGKV
jgi:uncharacterized protein involved in exopolysaccharide biosynthesis